jgi:hypothetical protein
MEFSLSLAVEFRTESLLKVNVSFPENYFLVRFVVFTTVTMNNGVFWDVRPCGSCI